MAEVDLAKLAKEPWTENSVFLYDLKENAGIKASSNPTKPAVRDLHEELFVIDKIHSFGPLSYLSRYYELRDCFFYDANPIIEESIVCFARKKDIPDDGIPHPDAIAANCNAEESLFTIFYKTRSGQILSTTFQYNEPSLFKVEAARLSMILDALEIKGANKEYKPKEYFDEECHSKGFFEVSELSKDKSVTDHSAVLEERVSPEESENSQEC
eukprot:GHVP01063705.1.p1 GENE.GHVP01063705.1~~GHVP01063705.1.p1  ORF type:complete len:213 (+),score=54.97 GHVP01063705.1:74-712(+)